MNYELLTKLIAKKSTEQDIKAWHLRLMNELQAIVIRELDNLTSEHQMVLTMDAALRHGYRCPRFNSKNEVRFKLKQKADKAWFDSICNQLKLNLKDLLDLEVVMRSIHPRKKRKLNMDGFYIPFYSSDFELAGEVIRVTYEDHPVYEFEQCTPFDELETGIVKKGVDVETKDVLLASVLAEQLDETRLESHIILDCAWLSNAGAHLEPDIFEELLNDRHLSQIEMKLINLANKVNASSTKMDLEANLCVYGDLFLHDAPTTGIAIKKLCQSFSELALATANNFPEEFEMQRKQRLGYEFVEGTSQKVDGKNVQGYGMVAAQSLSAIRK